MTTRRLFAACLVATTALLAACGDDDDDVLGPERAIIGTFTAVSLGGETLPIVEQSTTETGAECTEELTSLTLTFARSGAGTVRVQGRSNCETGTTFQTFDESQPFTFTLQGDQLSIVFGDDEPEVFEVDISGNTLTLTDVEENEVSVFRRV